MINEKTCVLCKKSLHRDNFRSYSHVCNFCRRIPTKAKERIEKELAYFQQWLDDPHHDKSMQEAIEKRVKELKKEARRM